MNVLETQEGPFDNSTKEGWQRQLDSHQKTAVAIFEDLDILVFQLEELTS